jgi:hypothetical protein
MAKESKLRAPGKFWRQEKVAVFLIITLDMAPPSL